METLTRHGMRLILNIYFLGLLRTLASSKLFEILDCNNACLLNWKVILIDIAKICTILSL